MGLYISPLPISGSAMRKWPSLKCWSWINDQKPRKRYNKTFNFYFFYYFYCFTDSMIRRSFLWHSISFDISLNCIRNCWRQSGGRNTSISFLMHYHRNSFPFLSLSHPPHTHPFLATQLKHLLLKVIQDYHPDKVADHHGEQWKLVSEEISKRLNRYFGELK